MESFPIIPSSAIDSAIILQIHRDLGIISRANVFAAI